MKKFFAISLIAAMALSVVACSNDDVEDPVNLGGGQQTIATDGANNGGSNNQDSQGAASDTYVFEYEGASIQVNSNVNDVIAVLGDDYTYFESESCAYQGKDKVYKYPSFTIYTYPDGDNDFISSIELKADTVSTPEGIALGATADDVKAAYGTSYEENGNVLVYTNGITELSFVIIDGSVEGIVYDYADLIQAQN